MKYAKGDFQLEKHKVSLSLCVLSVRFCICFCLFLCAFSVFCFVFVYLFLFCVLLFCDLPAGKKLFKNVDIFRSFSPSDAVSVSLSTSHRRQQQNELCALCSRRCSLFRSRSLLYTTTLHYTHTLACFAFGPFAFAYFYFLYFFCCSADCFRFACFCLYCVLSCFSFNFF